MQNTLKAWLADYSLTADDKTDKILLLESAGSVGIEQIYAEMKLEDTGLREETLRHVTDLFQRVVSRLVLNGYNVNTGLFYATAQLTGIIEQGKWDPKQNSVYVSFTQAKQLREAILQTTVQILGEKVNGMYIISGQDTATRAVDNTATAGRNFIVSGRMLKVVGTDPTVGISIKGSDGTITKLTQDMIAINNPAQLVILLPADLGKGTYTLTITTQYGKGGSLLKYPRSVSQVITLGGGEAEDPTV